MQISHRTINQIELSKKILTRQQKRIVVIHEDVLAAPEKRFNKFHKWVAATHRRLRFLGGAPSAGDWGDF
jgi:hypothetical protein